MIICAFENSPSIPSFLVTKIVYIGYGQIKKMTLFLLPFHSCAPCIFISYCCLCQCQAVCYYYMPVSIIRIQKLFVIGNQLFFYLTNKETSKGWVCDNFHRKFHFFLGAIHERHQFKYLKNLTVKVCKIWCNDVYKSIPQCDILWGKIIERNCFNSIFNTKVILRASPFVCRFHCFVRDYLQTGYSDLLDISYLFNNYTLKCIKAKIFTFNQKK